MICRTMLTQDTAHIERSMNDSLELSKLFKQLNETIYQIR